MPCSTSVLCCGTGLYRGDKASVFTKIKLVSFLGFHTHGKLLSRGLLLVIMIKHRPSYNADEDFYYFLCV
jgi:hypothetical protein